MYSDRIVNLGTRQKYRKYFYDIVLRQFYCASFTFSSISLISRMLSTKMLPNTMLSVSGQPLNEHTLIKHLSSRGL